MAQLGVGTGSGYSASIDTAQAFINGSPLAPDSNTRLDAEIINDITSAILAIETALGANPQQSPTYPSVVARLAAIEARLDALEGP